ncbi:hypothetical protein C8K30_103167 [Promicromonospora sp. AC04]|uniref:hypothetical protein n=1 Tax=Promicromonospora sp. AC04 TaxID=2135723 RepID=UPI000D340A2F|nr:hypothetical protein [Promicromonospora sp. AC04]PUB28746.1 hypothetical protein C8K30_103167 [Promicromonospora sp. AC04]
MKTLPDAGRRPAALSILALALAAWMSVPMRLLIPGNELDLGFTMNNAVFVVENAAMVGTVVLAVGSAALRAGRLLVASAVVVGVHLLFQVGTAVVQLVLGARPDLILGTLAEILVLVVVAAGVLLALLLRDPRSARRTGLIVALVGAVVHILWTSVLLPLVSMLSYGDLLPGIVGSLLLSTLLGLLGVAAAALCGWASPVARRIGAVLAAVVGAFGILAAAGSIGPLGGAYAAVQVLEGLLVLSAVVFAVVAGRRLATAATPPDAVAAEV